MNAFFLFTHNFGRDLLINQNVVRDYINFCYASNCLASNNYINSRIIHLNNNNGATTIKNNIFAGYIHQQSDAQGTFILNSIYNSLFENNIFYTDYNGGFWNCCVGSYSFLVLGNSNNTFVNNLFAVNSSNLYSNTGTGNLFNWNKVENFVNFNNDNWAFDYSKDYHLKPNAIGKNGGTDGTDIGIYGGSTPWKDGGSPIIPRIIQCNIPSETNNGTLNVSITVESQNQ